MRILIIMIISLMATNACAMRQEQKFMLPHQNNQLHLNSAQSSVTAADKRVSEQLDRLLYYTIRLYSALVNPQDPAHIVTQVGLGVVAGLGVSCLVPGTDVVTPVLAGIAVGTLSALRGMCQSSDERSINSILPRVASLSHKIVGKPE
jgi:hypothetical protein